MTKDSKGTVVPTATIARIFNEVSFKNEETRITLSTLELASEYIRLFINEAVIRSNEERLLEGDSLNKVDGIDNVQGGTADDFDDENTDGIDPPVDEHTQINTNVNLSNDTLDSRHLEKVAGILVLDF